MSQKEATAYTNVPINEKETNVDNSKADAEVKKNAKYDMLGFLFGIAGGILNTVGFGCVQVLKGKIPPLQLYVMRAIFALFSMLVLFIVKREWPKVERKTIPYVAIYVLLATLWFFTLYTAVSHIPLGVAGSVTRIGAMLIVLPLARIFLGESITILKILGVAVGSIGLILVCKPDIFYSSEPKQSPPIPDYNWTIQNSSLIFNASTTWPDYSSSSDTPKYEIIGYVCAALTALNSVVHNIIQKRKLPRVSVFTLMFWLAPCSIVIGAISSAIFEDIIVSFDVKSWLLIVVHCLCGVIATTCVIQAQKTATMVVAQLALSLQICFNFIGQYFFLQSIFPTEGTWLEIFGAVLSAASVTLVPAIQFITSMLSNLRS